MLLYCLPDVRSRPGGFALQVDGKRLCGVRIVANR